LVIVPVIVFIWYENWNRNDDNGSNKENHAIMGK